MSTKSPLALAGLAVGILTIGFSAILIRMADAPGAVTVLYRTAIPALAFLPVFAARWFMRIRRGFAIPWKSLGFAALAGILFGLDMASWSTAVKLAGATIPTLLANTAPIWVGLGTTLLFKQPLRRGFWIGLAVTFAGITVISVQGLGGGTMSWPAIGLGLLAGLLYGLFYLAAQKGREGLGTIDFFWIYTAFAALGILAVNLAAGNPIFGYSRSTYAILFLLAFSAQTVGWIAINYAQGKLPASLVSPSMLGQPVVTAVFAGPLVGDALSFWDLAGGAVVITGIFLVHRSHEAAKPTVD